jgi:hypothetical protein
MKKLFLTSVAALFLAATAHDPTGAPRKIDWCHID